MFDFEKIFHSLPEDKRYIQLNEQQARILAELVAREKPHLILEIGTAVGYSTAWLATNLAAESKLISIEKNLEHYNLAQDNLRNLPNIQQIELLHGDAATILPLLAEKYKSFDFTFVDANKRAYPQYYKFCQQYLSEDGIMAFDNVYNFAGADINTHSSASKRLQKVIEAMHEFHALVRNDPSLHIIDSGKQSNLFIARKINPASSSSLGISKTGSSMII